MVRASVRGRGRGGASVFGVTAGRLPTPDRAPTRERLAPYGIVLGLGVTIAGGIALSAERDALAWALPILVVTALLLVLITLIDTRPEQRRLQRAAADLGLRHQAARTLPPVTPVLAAMREPRTVQALEGDLDAGGPAARLAEIRLAGVRIAVCLTDLPGRDQGLEDPHGVLETTGIAAPPAPADRDTAAWVAGHPLHLGYATGDDALVVFCPVRPREDAPLRALRDATRELRPRLTASA